MSTYIPQREDLETGRLRLNITKDVLEDVSRRGIFFQPATPPYQLPPLTQLDDDDLGDLLSTISTYCAFVDEELARASMEYEAAKSQEAFVRARVRIELRDHTKLKADEARDQMEVDKRVVESRANTLYAKAMYEVVEVKAKNSQRDWDTVSRRITQRGQEIDRIRRGINVESQRDPTTGPTSPFGPFGMKR